jgi:hypothetical protein
VDQLAAGELSDQMGCVAALHGPDLFGDQVLKEHGRHLQVRISEDAACAGS